MKFSNVSSSASSSSSISSSLSHLLSNWPSAGRIEFTHVDLRYRPNLPLALDDVSFVIPGGAKVGVVGRTGSGKSSLLLALLRIVEAEWQKKGCAILIDGRDIHTQLGLKELRGAVAVTAQEPILLSGSIRYNLDPFGEHSEEEVWGALGQVGLWEVVQQMKEQLGADVASEGQNFSVGQRQLLCLARALLRRSRIILMDEATASVDFETDERIQQVTRQCFSECTVITIAHRLSTVADSDLVFVMDSGKLVESGAPKELLFRENSKFLSLAKAAGDAYVEQLRAIALKS
ncbi:putative multidrug resistance-associated protein 14 [Monocercomonoides exilis]|uniref:putative multidrug resistance-associated protein 14 n=1 Tax=Monocercomonoides exilis TaxID=2049356 RepID=UPI0035594F96|nr:putative multidrug resistance-associated protein 14 [Monocercomonoides exilis]|eukprot:MONOS_11586.1-p1 / transcript=MONOS_11586.1 / gene=MONOS_11586 / organism=Monocercomonoides_exilis_PA203 / gene_product=multidrug resistance-associated protein 14 / transcript_product=multidrug resistance-associated protein 14 / location=Mono_scaffold00589:12108-13139(-) / protein_length=289 / sequence_SO=supercontig / SO=protein_coding / is_pseudo=false